MDTQTAALLFAVVSAAASLYNSYVVTGIKLWVTQNFVSKDDYNREQGRQVKHRVA